MRRIKSVLILLLPIAVVLTPIDSKADLIQAGDTVRFDFTLSTEQQSELPINLLALFLYFNSGGLWDPGENFRLRAFDANPTQIYNAVGTQIFSSSTNNVALYLGVSPDLTTATGYIQLSDVDGSFDLNRAIVEGVVDINTHLQFETIVTVTHSAVPEPSTMLLLGSGLLGLLGLRRKFKR